VPGARPTSARASHDGQPDEAHRHLQRGTASGRGLQCESSPQALLAACWRGRSAPLSPAGPRRHAPCGGAGRRRSACCLRRSWSWQNAPAQPPTRSSSPLSICLEWGAQLPRVHHCVFGPCSGPVWVWEGEAQGPRGPCSPPPRLRGAPVGRGLRGVTCSRSIPFLWPHHPTPVLRFNASALLLFPLNSRASSYFPINWCSSPTLFVRSYITSWGYFSYHARVPAGGTDGGNTAWNLRRADGGAAGRRVVGAPWPFLLGNILGIGGYRCCCSCDTVGVACAWVAQLIEADTQRLRAHAGLDYRRAGHRAACPDAAVHVRARQAPG